MTGLPPGAPEADPEGLAAAAKSTGGAAAVAGASFASASFASASFVSASFASAAVASASVASMNVSQVPVPGSAAAGVPVVRVMICDDSATVRGILARLLAVDAGIEVVARVADGQQALDALAAVRPDVILLDLEMPVMDGMTALPRLLRADQRLAVIVASAVTQRGAAEAMAALRAGACDYIPKPGAGRGGAADPVFRAELLEKVKGWARMRRRMAPPAQSWGAPGLSVPGPLAPGPQVPESQAGPAQDGAALPTAPRPGGGESHPAAEVHAAPEGVPRASSSQRAPGAGADPREMLRPVAPPAGGGVPLSGFARQRPAAVPAARAGRGQPAAPRPAPAAVAPPRPARPGALPSLLALGSSTGGPQALAAFLRSLTAVPAVPVVIVQHMPAGFTAMLADHLDRLGVLPVAEAKEGEPLRAGRAYVAPGDRHLLVERGPAGLVARLRDDPPENFCRPAVDPMLRSAQRSCEARVLAVILTGMGQDGLEGCRALAAAGGTVLAQDEASSVVWGMPGAVARAGIAREVLPPERLGARVSAILAGTGGDIGRMAS